MDLEFLKSNRFWALVIGAISLYLKQKGWFGDSEMLLIATIAAGFIGIRTVDRFGEQAGFNQDPESLEEQ